MNNSRCKMLTAKEKKDAEQISRIFKKLIKKEFKKKKTTKKTFGFHGKVSKKSKRRRSKRGGAFIGVVGSGLLGLLSTLGFKSMAMKSVSALLYVLVYTFIISYYYKNSSAFYAKVSGDFIDIMTPVFRPELTLKNMTISEAVNETQALMVAACEDPEKKAWLDSVINLVKYRLDPSISPTEICREYEDALLDMKRKEEDMIMTIADYIAKGVGSAGAFTVSKLFTPRAYELFINIVSRPPRAVPRLRPYSALNNDYYRP